MLYQKGEKLAELRKTLKSIPELSGLDSSLFTMPEEEFKNFKTKILCAFNDLSDALFSTLLDGKEDKCKERVEASCNSIIAMLNTEDLVENFYKEKQLYYKFMFYDLIEVLKKYFPGYIDSLCTIQEAYMFLYDEERLFNFPKIENCINELSSVKFYIDRECRETEIEYLHHCLEVIYEEITILVKKECDKKYEDPDVLLNKLRQLTYYLEDKLEHDLKTEE